jgi:hypothetical protein
LHNVTWTIYNFRRKVGVRPRWWAYGSTLFEFKKRRAISTAFFGTFNYKLWWIISDLQFLGDWWRPLLSFWCPCNHEAKDRCKGRKESLGKETDAWDLDEHFDVIALMLEPPASYCVCLCVRGGGVGHVPLKIMLWALEIFL